MLSRILDKPLKCPKCGKSYGGTIRFEKLYKSIYLDWLKNSNEVKCYLCKTIYVYPKILQFIFKYLFIIFTTIIFLLPFVIILVQFSIMIIITTLLSGIVFLYFYYFFFPIILSYIAYFSLKKKIK